jgi:RNA polymerase sigma-70 factor (ECF subfamily)
LDEVALVRAAQAGDRAAFGSLYQIYSRMVYGILLAHVKYCDAEDLLQDVFLKAMQQLSSLREASSVGAWLASIARRTGVDHHRRSRLTIVDDAKASTGSVPPESREALDCILRLPEAYRETLILRLVEGMNGPEIAARTGMTPGSVRVNLCRGVKLLRDLMEGQKYE